MFTKNKQQKNTKSKTPRSKDDVQSDVTNHVQSLGLEDVTSDVTNHVQSLGLEDVQSLGLEEAWSVNSSSNWSLNLWTKINDYIDSLKNPIDSDSVFLFLDQVYLEIPCKKCKAHFKNFYRPSTFTPLKI
jgi:hypothetical protein